MDFLVVFRSVQKVCLRRFRPGAGGILVCLALAGAARAQDTLRYYVEGQSAVASQDYLPHWLTTKRFGILDCSERAVSWLRSKVTYER